MRPLCGLCVRAGGGRKNGRARIARPAVRVRGERLRARERASAREDRRERVAREAEHHDRVNGRARERVRERDAVRVREREPRAPGRPVQRDRARRAVRGAAVPGRVRVRERDRVRGHIVCDDRAAVEDRARSIAHHDRAHGRAARVRAVGVDDRWSCHRRRHVVRSILLRRARVALCVPFAR